MVSIFWASLPSPPLKQPEEDVAPLDCPDDGGVKFLRNFDTYMTIHIESQYLRSSGSSSALLREPRTSHAILMSTAELKEGVTNGRTDRHMQFDL